MTSLIGFEALIRGIPVTTYGAPFYAGWGLTVDKSDVPPRRRVQPNIDALAHAVLIDYPRYYDPKTKLHCPAEIAVLRLSQGDIPRQTAPNGWSQNCKEFIVTSPPERAADQSR